MRWIDRLARRRVVCHLKDGSSLRGWLIKAYRDALILENADALTGDTTTPIDGQTVIPRANLSWIQDLGVGEQ